MITQQQIEAAAESDAKFDGHAGLVSMQRVRRQRYLDRARLALEAAAQVSAAQREITDDASPGIKTGIVPWP